MARRIDSTPCPACPTPAAAWAWANVIAEAALGADEDALRLLPRVIEHALKIEARARG